MICPDCKGEGIQPIAFPHNKEMCTIKCTRCKGKKNVSDCTPEWQQKGEIVKNQRINKRITLRNACKKLKLDPVVASEMERGVIEPDINLYNDLNPEPHKG